ncbi:hypothetical protein DPMN_065217 [Dreissena polymorpha]|uniref:LRRNT domain-containing protein n=1 Tax=Dreissena polymorpha TaxID=45954 RepID=A0A9D4CDN3_DREPO|nr:hypothetical protein DPMN_065217 [Dreissena polymorpha]
MKSAYLTCVLALILALRTGVSRGQCEKCDCDGPRVKCSGKQLSTIPLSLPNATVLNLSNNTLASLPDGAFEGWQKLTELD